MVFFLKSCPSSKFDFSYKGANTEGHCTKMFCDNLENQGQGWGEDRGRDRNILKGKKNHTLQE